MNKTIWKISIRNLLKNKMASSISVFGLALGFTAFIIISLFIRFELSWDQTNENYDRIYRVQRHYAKTAFAMDGNDISPHSSAITAPLLEKYPEFDRVSVIRENLGQFISATPDQQFYNESSICADSNFFSIFSYPLIEGTSQTALKEPYSIVLSKKMAQKLFKGKEALGKTITIEKKFDVKVTGVYTDLPKNSSIRPEYIISFSTLETTANIRRDDLYTGDCMIWAMLKPGIDSKTTGQKIKNLFAEYKGFEFEELQLCPMSKIHLNSNGRNDYYVMLSMFGLIGLFILLMSAFNYVNLTIANTSTRGKEVAIKKIHGGNKSSLIIQFLCETLILSFASIIISFGLVKLLLPLYNSIVNTEITVSFIRDWKIVGLLIIISLVIGFLSGIYPAFFMSSHKIVNLFKGRLFKTGKEIFDVRKILVTTQFAISIFLICLSLFFMAQINYMANKDLGFSKENLLYVKLTSSVKEKNFEELRNRLLQNPEIIDASMSRNLPFVNFGGGMINWEGGAPDEKISYRPNTVSYDFVKNMGITVVAGRDFSREFAADVNQNCLINETALRCFGWDEPIGKRINNNQWTVVGVVKDYHFKDMHNAIEPAVLLLTSGEMTGNWSFAFRYSTGNRNKVRQLLESEFVNTFPNDPFEFHDLASTFRNEQTFKLYRTIKRSIIFFTLFNIFLAIIGLLGLVSFTTLRRTKEIGIRKINGSTVGNIFIILNREFLIMLGASLTVAWPGAYLAYKALPGTYKIAPQLWIPLLSAFIILLIILATTSYQTLKAAKRNPIEALRYE